MIKAIVINTILACTALCASFDTAYSQSLMAKNDSTPIFENYKFVEECLAAIERRGVEIEYLLPVWRDTIKFDKSYMNRPYPKEVHEIARRCLPKISLDTIAFKNPDFWLKLMFISNRHEEVEKWYLSHLDSVAPLDRVEHAINLFTAIAETRPIRTDYADRLFKQLSGTIPADSFEWRIPVYLGITHVTFAAGDEALTALYLGKIANFIDSVPEKVKAQTDYAFRFAPLLHVFLSLATENEGLDSLRQSAQAQLSYREAIWKRVYTTPYSESKEGTGLTALPIDGKHWYAASKGKTEKAFTPTSKSIRPVPGKLNIILFLTGECHEDSYRVRFGRKEGTGDRCWRPVAVTRRLIEQFPDIQLTVVSKTFGNIGRGGLLSPKDEADSLASYFLGFHRLPGNLIIDEGAYFKISGLDGRRIDGQPQFESDYSFRGGENYKSPQMVITDGDGKIFFSGIVYDVTEGLIEKMINAVNKRSPR